MSEDGLEQTKWEVLRSELIFEHPFITVSMEQVLLPNGRLIPDWPKIHTNDYVNALVINKDGEALIFEGYRHGTGRVTWQLMGGYIETGEDPLTAVQRELLEESGYSASEWTYLGSFIVDPNRHIGVGHLFCAQNALPKTMPNNDDLEESVIRWVPLKDLRHALIDGRLAAMSYATTVSLALLTILK
ncbi:MAG: NUDIX hydrolase [Chloroflexi bacterium]|nr:NUDIX hydrolase [Chloroflexota bacterium]